MKENDEHPQENPEEPQLTITDDLNDDEPTLTEPVVETVPEETEPTSTPTSIEVKDAPKSGFKQKLAAFLKTKKGKVIAIIVGVLLVLGILFAIPTTRYAIAGLVIKKDVTLTVIDQDSHKPVSSATVSLGATNIGQTDAKGNITLSSVPVGQYRLKIDKKYYLSSSSNYLVPILSAPQNTKPQIKATGRAVTITVTNKLTGVTLTGAHITISDSSVVTNEQGEAQIILPVQTAPQKGNASADNYSSANFELTVNNSDDQKLSVPLTPSGQIYFLSKRTGTIDVMKSNLDGSNPQTVVAGTDQESDTGTILLSTTDWKYLALLASRDSDKPKLYLIDTSTGKLSTIDEGDADFQLVGWSGHQFVYLVNRNTPTIWADKRQALKSFNAETTKLTTIDETQGSGSSYYDYAAQSIGTPYIVEGVLAYTKSWDVGPYAPVADRNDSIIGVNVDGTAKKDLKDFAVADISYFDARSYEPGGVYFRATNRSDGKGNYYEFEDGAVKATADTNDQKFYNTPYATYLISPSGTKTLWYESRDGKNVIFVGDKDGKNGREVGTSDYIPYGWYTDNYILMSKNGSELYVYDAKGTFADKSQPLKVTDYHKPAINFPGYGSGYGGQ